MPLVPNTLIAARLFAAGRAWKVAWVSGLGAAATFELNAIFVPALGPVGAGWAILGAELAMLGLFAPELRADLGLRLPRRPAFRPLRMWAAPVLGGLALAGGLRFVLLPEVFRRYAARQPVAGLLDGRAISLGTLALTVVTFLLCLAAGRGRFADAEE